MNRLYSYIAFLISIVIIGVVSYFINEILSGESTTRRFLIIYTSFMVTEIFYNLIFEQEG